MSALEHLRSVAGGEAPADDGLLGNARCAWGRGEILGEEAILAAFCAKPYALESVLAVETAQSTALISNNDAMVADIYDGRIGRLWRVGHDIASAPEPAVDVPFDSDLRQIRGDVYFRAEDHPELDHAASERILSAARTHVEQVRKSGGLRVRAFVVRAFGTSEASAAVLSVYAMSNEPSRTAAFSYAIVGLGAGDVEPQIVSEQTAPRDWTPRL